MQCEQARERLSEYLDGELTEELAAVLRSHLDTCADCQALLAGLRATTGLLARLPVRLAPKDLAQQIQREIERRTVLEAAPAGQPQPHARGLSLRRGRLWRRAVAVAAAVLLAIGLGLFAWMANLIGPGLAPTAATYYGTGKENPAAPLAEELDRWEVAADKRKSADGEGMPAAVAGKAGPARQSGTDADVGGALGRALKTHPGEALLQLQDAGPAAVQMAMNYEAEGRAPKGLLMAVANENNLSRVDNQLVLSGRSRDAANRELQQLFVMNGWHAVPSEREDTYGAVAGRGADAPPATVGTGAVGGREAPPPAGVYSLVSRNGEDVWVVLTDANGLSRFGNQLAQASGRFAAVESSRQFEAVLRQHRRLLGRDVPAMGAAYDAESHDLRAAAGQAETRAGAAGAVPADTAREPAGQPASRLVGRPPALSEKVPAQEKATERPSQGGRGLGGEIDTSGEAGRAADAPAAKHALAKSDARLPSGDDAAQQPGAAPGTQLAEKPSGEIQPAAVEKRPAKTRVWGEPAMKAEARAGKTAPSAPSAVPAKPAEPPALGQPDMVQAQPAPALRPLARKTPGVGQTVTTPERPGAPLAPRSVQNRERDLKQAKSRDEPRGEQSVAGRGNTWGIQQSDATGLTGAVDHRLWQRMLPENQVLFVVRVRQAKDTAEAGGIEAAPPRATEKVEPPASRQ
jgi:hypothetical protein